MGLYQKLFVCVLIQVCAIAPVSTWCMHACKCLCKHVYDPPWGRQDILTYEDSICVLMRYLRPLEASCRHVGMITVTNV